MAVGAAMLEDVLLSLPAAGQRLASAPAAASTAGDGLAGWRHWRRSGDVMLR